MGSTYQLMQDFFHAQHDIATFLHSPALSSSEGIGHDDTLRIGHGVVLQLTLKGSVLERTTSASGWCCSDGK